jgi:BirA family biotin operon repressor/biotin-[acetyl-CoA-carboxylase] ligase
MTTQWRFEVVQTTESTNTDLLNRWHALDLHDPTALLAHNQTGGRGRRGNLWVSDANQSLTFSLAYPFPHSYSMMDLQGLTLAIGVSLVEGICSFLEQSEQDLRSRGFGLKWPNDLLYNDRKLGGILVEGGQKDSSSPIWMIIGVGLNISFHQDASNDLTTANVCELKPNTEIDPNKLWQHLCHSAGASLARFKEQHFLPFQETWNNWNVWKNKGVSLHRDGQIYLQGDCLGVNQFGHLNIQTAHSIEVVSSGEVSLRKFST